MKKIAFLLVVLLLAAAMPARAEVALDIKLNFFGPAAGGQGGANVATSFQLKSLVQRNLKVQFTAESLLAELKKTFNVPDVSLLASADLAWRSGGPASVTQVVQIDGRDYVLVLSPLPKPGTVNFKVGVVEERDAPKIKKVLLDTEVVLPDGEVAMLGFRDSQERSYFVAFYVQGRDEAFAKGVTRLAGGEKPKLVKKVVPVYPDEAAKKGMEGSVVLEAVLDKGGKVSDVRVVSSAGPLLDIAAMDAVRQWEYEPYSIDSACAAVLFTVTLSFRLSAESKAKAAAGPQTRLEDAPRPKLVKKVAALYPQAAKEKKIQGAVKLEATIDERGKVSDLKIISSPDPLLAEAAAEAVRQWEYEPFVKDGTAKAVVFTVTVNFTLK
jgi:TonB family protein